MQTLVRSERFINLVKLLKRNLFRSRLSWLMIFLYRFRFRRFRIHSRYPFVFSLHCLRLRSKILLCLRLNTTFWNFERLRFFHLRCRHSIPQCHALSTSILSPHSLNLLLNKVFLSLLLLIALSLLFLTLNLTYRLCGFLAFLSSSPLSGLLSFFSSLALLFVGSLDRLLGRSLSLAGPLTLALLLGLKLIFLRSLFHTGCALVHNGRWTCFAFLQAIKPLLHVFLCDAEPALYFLKGVLLY